MWKEQIFSVNHEYSSFTHLYILFSLSRLEPTLCRLAWKWARECRELALISRLLILLLPFLLLFHSVIEIFFFLSLFYPPHFSFFSLTILPTLFSILVNLTQMWICLSSFVPLSSSFTHSIIFALFSFTWVPSEDARARDECEIKIGNSQCCTRLFLLLGKWNNSHDSCVGFRCIFLCCYVIWSLWPCP